MPDSKVRRGTMPWIRAHRCCGEGGIAFEGKTGVNHTFRRVAVVALSIWFASAVGAAETPLKTFANDWQGRRVVLKRPLYSLVFDEAGRFGGKTLGKTEGLTVATPLADTYYLFDGRRGEGEVVERDLNRLLETVRTRYQRSKLMDLGTASVIAPAMVIQYQAGTELIVRTVTVTADRDRVRLVLQNGRPDAQDDRLTSLTIQWPAALSNAFTERAQVEALIAQFLDVVSP